MENQLLRPDLFLLLAKKLTRVGGKNIHNSFVLWQFLVLLVSLLASELADSFNDSLSTSEGS